MNRRTFLISGGGTAVAVAGGTAAARATRADILADGELTRGRGAAATRAKTVTRESVEYLASTNRVREDGHTAPFNQWARRESATVAASEVISVVESRLDVPVEGVGSGVRYLLFGPVVTVDHTVTRDRDGSVMSEPTVTRDQLVSVTPGTMTVTVTLDGHALTTDFPVGVGHREVSMD